MCEYAKQVMGSNIHNAGIIGKMKHGEYLNIGVGIDTVMEIRCWELDNGLLAYAYQVNRLGEKEEYNGKTSFYHVLQVFERLAMTDFDR